MNILTSTQIELLKNEDVKDLMKRFAAEYYCADDNKSMNAIMEELQSKFTVEPELERKVLFTTADGVDIFSEETETWRTRDGKVFKCQTSSPYRDSLMWSTKEKATEYVLLNSPKLSVAEVMKCYSLIVPLGSPIANKLKLRITELVKSKQ